MTGQLVAEAIAIGCAVIAVVALAAIIWTRDVYR